MSLELDCFVLKLEKKHLQISGK